MGRWTRRQFLEGGVKAAAAGTAILGGSCSSGPSGALGGNGPRQVISLSGTWLFRFDPSDQGEAAGWQGAGASAEGWDEVEVPHTWQVSERTADYLGRAWYRKEFDALPAWAGGVVRLEFEAVFHTAHVWVNGKKAGEHTGKGYTAFAFDVTPFLVYGAANTIAVRVDNAFSPDMLPRGNSYDWAPDGGITRPVHLILTPEAYFEHAWIDALPDPGKNTASLRITVVVRNASPKASPIEVGYRVLDEASGRIVLDNPSALSVSVPAGAVREIELPIASLDKPKLWHFDHPHLYFLEARIAAKGKAGDSLAATFGVRRIEVRGAAFLLNGEPVRLAGVERMAGSHPAYGMAEPASWIAHDNDDLKELNCIFSRVHWQQDKRLLDECDRKGILIQVEVPTWGPDTFKGMEGRPAAAVMENGLEQLREMIGRDRNHPSIFSWGLCNEIGGQNPAAREFVRAMLREAKRLDPNRLCSYASNSLQSTPEKDVAGEMDFIEWNEYYETWYGGTAADMRRSLEAIHGAFPDKPVVISEYGFCACTEDRPEGDEPRIRILREHNRVFRDYPWLAGLIFFCYNDYRTHIGDKGFGVLKQRIHGVVDLYGARKPSFEALRAESSPIESLTIEEAGGGTGVVIRTRDTVPAYTLSGYSLRWICFGRGLIPLVLKHQALPDLKPGDEIRMTLEGGRPAGCTALKVDILRPTGYSALTGKA